MTQKDLKNLVKKGMAEDISDMGCETFYQLKKKEGEFLVELTTGTYGRNGALLQGTKTKKLYVSIGRNDVTTCCS